MSLPLEDYALLGDLYSAALTGRDGSVDWLCLPRFDGGAVFSALLGTEEHGHWRLAPQSGGSATRRSYRQDTLILDSEWDTSEGTVRITEFMSPRDTVPNLFRIVEGVSGEVAMRSTVRFRFDYGKSTPWVHHHDGKVTALAGPDAVTLVAVPLDGGEDITFRGRNFATRADFVVRPGERVAFVLTWHASHEPEPEHAGPEEALATTADYWTSWAAKCTYQGPYREAVMRSLITLKALIYDPTGGIVAAPTTSLPEDLGGVRNWDYRFCWLRDATLTLEALLRTGYSTEAEAWREWLLRAIAGDPAELHILYGLSGERRIPEYELDWLPGYEGSKPVRVGNAAGEQRQLDVYGEVMNALALARSSELDGHDNSWALQVALMDWLEKHWHEPDEGIWEVRGGQRHFVHSKLLAWSAFDCAVRAVESGHGDGPVDRWRELRDEISDDILERGYDAERGSFVQYYGGQSLDAATLLMPRLGFLPPDDPRIVSTVDTICKELMKDGFLMRYGGGGVDQSEVDGLPGSEGAFLACSFWLVDALALIGRRDEAVALYERLLALANDVGLLAEEFDPRYDRQVGNFPQAFTHLALVTTAIHLADFDTNNSNRTNSKEHNSDA